MLYIKETIRRGRKYNKGEFNMDTLLIIKLCIYGKHLKQDTLRYKRSPLIKTYKVKQGKTQNTILSWCGFAWGIFGLIYTSRWFMYMEEKLDGTRNPFYEVFNNNIFPHSATYNVIIVCFCKEGMLQKFNSQSRSWVHFEKYKRKNNSNCIN